MPKRLPAVFLLFISLNAKAGYDMSADCRQAYSNIMAFRLDEGKNEIAQQKKASPRNLIPIYLEDISAFIKAFALEGKKDYEAFKTENKASVDALSEGDKTSPYYNFCLGETYLHAGLAELKFGDYTYAAWDIRKAYNLLEENTRTFPTFYPAFKDWLLLKSFVGTVPGNYRWMLKILGFEGDLKSSMAQFPILINSLDKNPEFQVYSKETRMLYGYLEYHLLNEQEPAWKEVTGATIDYTQNPLSAFVRANLAMRLKKNEQVIGILDAQVKSQPAIPYLDYLYGLALLQHLNVKGSAYLVHYLKNNPGDNFIKDAYLRLGWAFLLKNDTVQYKNCLVLLKNYGQARFESDKNALHEAERDYIPSLPLLKARLLYDGGYFNEAKKILTSETISQFRRIEEKAEYYYRLGRVDESLEDTDAALKYYDAVIANYSSVNEYYAPASCLYAGMLLEKKQEYGKARAYYKRCLSFNNYTYKDSFDQKAYSGLKRMNN